MWEGGSVGGREGGEGRPMSVVSKQLQQINVPRMIRVDRCEDWRTRLLKYRVLPPVQRHPQPAQFPAAQSRAA